MFRFGTNTLKIPSALTAEPSRAHERNRLEASEHFHIESRDDAAATEQAGRFRWHGAHLLTCDSLSDSMWTSTVRLADRGTVKSAESLTRNTKRESIAFLMEQRENTVEY